MILRGLWERRTLALVVLLIAVVPIASAAVGPIYSAAALTTIVRQAVHDAPVDGKGWRYTTHGPIEPKVAAFTAGAGFTEAPIFGLEMSSGSATPGDDRAYTLVWQDGQCEHLELAEGRCPSAALEVMASEASKLRVGDEVRLAALGLPGRASEPSDKARLKVVGVYRPGSPRDPFWFGRELFEPHGQPGRNKVDALFTVPETRSKTIYVGNVSEDQSGWTDYAVIYVDPHRLAGTDLALLTEMQALAESIGRTTSTIVFSRMADTLKAMHAGAGALSVPALLVAAQLVGLGWLLLFQTVGDLVRARGPEIALARLRGLGRLRVWRFALAEPMLLLLLAVPLGLAAGFGAAGLMIGALLPAGVPTTFPLMAALAGAAATLGGVVAAAVSAWRIATRPVTEEWRRTPRRSARGWVLDAVVLAVTALGLTELLAAGVITDPTGESASALAVPGLMALGVALLASRALPVVSRRLFGLTRRWGGLAPFLALRQVARGPVTAGSVIVLATAFGMATFAVAAWTATSDDYRRVAAFHNGAPAVIDVRPVEPGELAAAVEAADPGGADAAPVIRIPGTPQFIAADVERLARVATWDPAAAGGVGLAEAMAALRGVETERVWLTGDRFRVHIDNMPLQEGWSARLWATFRVSGRVDPVAVPIGTLRDKPGVYEWNLPLPCREARCELRRFHGDLTPVGAEVLGGAYAEVRVTKVEVREGGRWREVTIPGWRVDQDPTREEGMFVVADAKAEVLRPYTYDAKPPAIVVGESGLRAVPGLDDQHGTDVTAAVPVAAAPGFSDHGVLMDLEQADRIAYGVHETAQFQVWARQTDTAALEEALTREGLTVVSVSRTADLQAGYAAQGPGLALMLLLVSALAAAVLALGRTVLALHTAARRRGYELAALEAAGAKVPTLRRSLLLEQVLTVLTGMLAGLAAGLIAAEVTISRIPQFAEPVVTPPLTHEVAAAPVAIVTGVAVAASLLCALLVSELLLRAIRVERLRDTPA